MVPLSVYILFKAIKQSEEYLYCKHSIKHLYTYVLNKFYEPSLVSTIAALVRYSCGLRFIEEVNIWLFVYSICKLRMYKQLFVKSLRNIVHPCALP